MKRHKPRRQRVRAFILLVSWLLFPVTIFYFSPYLIIAGAAAGLINGSAIVFAIMLLSALVFGRAYCGWVCPAGAMQDAALEVNNRRVPAWLGWVKWAVWIPWMATIVLVAMSAGGFSSINPLFGIESGISLVEPASYIIYAVVTGLVLLMATVAGRHGFCHSMCWMAPFMIIGRRISNMLHLPALRLRADAASCVGCQVCTRGCPMSLEVHQMVRQGSLEHSSCILCGTCVDNCHHKVIHFSFAPPAQAPRGEQVQVLGEALEHR